MDDLDPYHDLFLKRKMLPKEALLKNIIVRVHEKCWMDESLVKDWLKLSGLET